MPNVHQIVTERIIRLLEQGVIPWQKPWQTEPPKNLVSKKAYRGINLLLLSNSPFASPYWLTYRQAKQLGGFVRQGEKGTLVVYWNWVEKPATEPAESGKEPKLERIPFLRYYTVFNSEQCEGVKVPASNRPAFNPIADCERIAAGMPNPPSLEHRGQKAYYSPAFDRVTMPPKETFQNPESYYSTLFHELAHSTGHQSRLARESISDMQPFGSTNYSKEELVAEMGAAMLCATVGIENLTIDNSAAYIGNWLSALRGDSHLVVVAASQAQKALDYILNRNGETDAN